MDNGVPQWKPWYRWPFLALSISGAAMAIFGVQQCFSLWTAIRDGAPEIVVETAMSAFPPVGVAIMAGGCMGLLPRTADGTGIRPAINRHGVEYNPAQIIVRIMLVGLLLYPIFGITLRAVTTNVLTTRGYSETESKVSHTSGYITTHWRRGG